MRTRRRPPWWLHLMALPFLATILYAIFGLQDDQAAWIGILALGTLLLFVGTLATWGVWSAEQRRREAQALVDWGAGRGLELSLREPSRDASTLTGGGAVFDTVLRGPLVGERPGTVSHLAIGLKRTMPLMFLVPFWGAAMEDTVDLWTVSQLALGKGETAGLGRLVLSRRDLLDLPALAAARDRAGSLRHVELESMELHDVYELEVADRADDLAVRRIFSPAFVVFLVERAGEPLLVELRRQTLTVAQRGRLLEPADLDRLLDDLRRVAAAVAPATAREVSTASPVAVQALPGMSRRMRLASIVVAAVILVGIFVTGLVSMLSAPG